MLFSAALNAFATECDPQRLLKSIIMSDAYTHSDRLTILNALRSKQPANLLSPVVVGELEKIANLPAGSIAAGKFDAETMIDFLSEHLAHSDARGEQMQWLVKLNEGKVNFITDQNDLNRGYGFLLLPKNDEVFSTPSYLNQYLGLRKQGGHSMWNAHTDGKGIEAYRSFEDAWNEHFSAFSPYLPGYSERDHVRLDQWVFFQSGSDANNALFEISNHAAAKRLGKEKLKDSEILFFEGAYGAGRGRMKEIGFFNGRQKESSEFISAPYTTTWNPTDKKEIAALIKKENLALDRIRKKATRKSKPIGGLLLEAIPGAYGVTYFRPQFLEKLRSLCDELKIPIFADEILNGGGRTGKFFSYQHYSNFEPDFVTFGKGLHVAGIARVNRKDAFSKHLPEISSMVGMYNTLTGNAEALLKGAAVLNKIKKQNLIENADKMGKYFVQELRKIGFKNARGKGLLISPSGRFGPGSTNGRFMPYMTITKKQVDQIIADLKKRRGPQT